MDKKEFKDMTDEEKEDLRQRAAEQYRSEMVKAAHAYASGEKKVVTPAQIQELQHIMRFMDTLKQEEIEDLKQEQERMAEIKELTKLPPGETKLCGECEQESVHDVGDYICRSCRAA